jgi:hypothetical protein
MDTARFVDVIALGGLRVDAARVPILAVRRAFHRAARGRRRSVDDDVDTDARVVIARASPVRAARRGRGRARVARKGR